MIAGTALLAALAVAVTLAALTMGEGSGVAVLPNSVAAIDPESGDVVAAIPVGAAPPEVLSGAVPSGAVPLTGAPRMVAASDEWVWVLHENAGSGTISKIDANSQRVVNTFSVTGEPVDLIAAADSLWVSTRQGHVFRIDPSSDEVTGDWTLPNAGKGVGPASLFQGVGSLAYGTGTIWVASYRAISRINPATSTVVPRTSSVWGPLAYGFGSLWVLPDESCCRALRLAPRTLEPKRDVRLPYAPLESREVVAGEGGVWLTDAMARVVHVSPEDGRLERAYEIGGRITGLAVGSGAIWAASGDDYIVRIDPVTHRTERIDLGETPLGMAIGGGLVWVAVAP